MHQVRGRRNKQNDPREEGKEYELHSIGGLNTRKAEEFIIILVPQHPASTLHVTECKY